MKNPKNILITGASSGIGEALALYYARQGVHLYLTGRNEARLTQVVRECEASGASVEGKIIDVVDQEAMRAWVENLGTVDLAIANAGISGGTSGRKEGEPIDQARLIFGVNIIGVLNTIEPVLAKMRIATRAERGQIAIISSLAGFRGFPGSPAYSASKGAVRFYGEAMRGSLKETGIQINVVCPGFVKSRITDVNDFPMPFFMQADKAARLIATGLEKNKGRICFPWPMHFMSWFLGVLPDTLAQKILSKAPAKGAVQ